MGQAALETAPETRFDDNEENRVDELLAIINMIGYAKCISKDLGVPAAANDLQNAVLKLVAELQSETNTGLSGRDLVQLAGTRAGTC